LGLLGICLPEAYGGSGSPLLHALTVIEELAKVCRPAAFQVFEANTGPARVVELYGTADQKARTLPRIARGEATMAVAISEPDAGSAATDMRTNARSLPGGYTINGRKRWISNGGEADFYLVYCRFDAIQGSGGIGALLVESTQTGVSFGNPERLMGFRGIPSADVVFDDVYVPEDQLVLGPGSFSTLFGAFSIERLGNATMSLAIGQTSLDRAIEYVTTRHQFGKPLIEFQNIQLAIADMLVQVRSARLLIERAAGTTDERGLPNPLDVSLAKCAANEMAKKVSDVSMQLHGASGYTEEFGIERLHRDAHGWALAGGTPTMQRIRIASQYLGRRFDQRR
jgi:alkylation response protein AidB-like acyl-CoA dehydrogenase